MQRCDPFREQILEGADSAALAEHLRACADCRGLQASHQSALGLRGLALPPPPRVDPRRVVRRLGAATAVCVSLVVAGLLWPRPGPQATAPAPVAEARRFSEADAIWTVFWAQHDARRTEPAASDLPAFGPLGDWVAPSRRPQPPMTVVWQLSEEE